jgi:hypothetical protein
MLVYVNNLGITCIEPDEGHLIRKIKSGQVFKKIYLNKKDNVNNYEQIVDVNYVFEEHEDKVIDDNNLAKAKSELIKLSKFNLSEYLENNPLFSTVKYEDGRKYNVTLDKQNLLASNIIPYQFAQQQGLDYQLEWNDTGEISEPWSIEELVQLSIEIKNYVSPIVQQQQHIEKAIKGCKTIEELQQIDMSFKK